MTCVHIHRKVFGFKINPQNTVTLSALRCNDFQPLTRYFCQMKLMMPASKQTPCLAHLKHCAFPVWAPFWIMQNVNPNERVFVSEGECQVNVLASLRRLCALMPQNHLNMSPQPTFVIKYCSAGTYKSAAWKEMTQRGKWGTNGNAYYQKC